MFFELGMYMALVKANLQEDILCGSQAGGFISGTFGRTGIHVRIPVSLEISPGCIVSKWNALKLLPEPHTSRSANATEIKLSIKLNGEKMY